MISDSTMGLNTDDEEMSTGSTVPVGLESTEKTCGFEQQPESEKSLPEDPSCDTKIQDQNPTDGTDIQPISLMYNVPQCRLNTLNTNNKEEEEEHENAGDSALSALSQRYHSDRVDDISEPMQSALGAGNTVTSADLEESSSPPTPAEIVALMDTNGNDDCDAMYDALQGEMQLFDSDLTRQDLHITPDIDLVDDEGYTPLYKAASKGHFESVNDLISHGANPDKPSKGGLTPLHAAAQEGHENIVDYLILQGADVNMKCEMGRTPRHTALEKGHTDIMDIFLAEETDLIKKDKTGRTPFNAAVQYGQLEALADLLSKGAKQNRYRGYTPLYWATHYGHLHIVKFLISKGADVNEVDDRGMIPLHGAAFTGHVDVMEYLVLKGSDLNKGDSDGWTPFNAAIQEGHLKAVGYLITKGAKQNRCDGKTPLYFAANCGHLHLVKFLIVNGEDVNEENDNGMIPLHGASIHGNIEVMEYLIQQGSDLNKSGVDGWTPFNAAVQYGHLQAVKYLIDKGAKQNRYDGMTPLFAAAYFGHLDLVKFFISEGADVNEEDDEGMIPLHGAAFKGDIEVMEYLIQQGSDVNKGDHKGWTPFNAAVQYGHLEAVKCLIAKGAKQNRYGEITPLYAAAGFGHLDLVKFFISEGGDVNEEHDKGIIPLHGAAARGHKDVVKYLIQLGSDVNRSDVEGWTPFNASVEYGHLEAVKYLISNGAKENTLDGMTPSYVAAQGGHLDCLKFFISNGADVNEEDEMGQIPLHGAAARGHLRVLEYLVQQRSDVNKKNHTGWTPFHFAVRNGHLEAVKLLMANGAQGTGIHGMTALYIATQYDHIEVAKHLVSKGYDINERGERGRCLFHAACYNGNLDFVKYLHLQNANLNEQDRDGWTPLHAAAQEGHQDVVEFLTLNGAEIIAKDTDGMTPLQAAEKGGHKEILEYLTVYVGDTLNKDRLTGNPRYGTYEGDTQNHHTSSKYVALPEDDDGYRSEENVDDTMNQDSGNPRYGSCQENTIRHHTSNEFEAPLKHEDRYGSEGMKHMKSPEKRFAPEQSLDGASTNSMDGYSLADTNEKDITAIHNECLHTMRPLLENEEKDESNPFVSARLKYPEKTATTAEQKKVNGSEYDKGSVSAERKSCAGRDLSANTCPAQCDRSTRGFSTDHNAFSLLNGPPKRGSFDQSFLCTTETNCHSYKETDPRCHTILGEPLSSMNARNGQTTTEIEKKCESVILTKPVAEDHHKSKDGNPFSTKITSVNSRWKTKKTRKRRSENSPYSSFLVLIQSFLHMIIALAIILAGSPVLVAGSTSNERVTLQAGKSAVIPFNLTWPSTGESHSDPYLTLRFESISRPFYMNGHLDVDGFKSPSQLPRFTTSLEKLATSLCLNLLIENVDTLDEDMYELTVIQHDFQDILYETFRKKIVVQIPPGPAKCFLTKSENNNYPYEVHCEAATGSSKTTLTCYQNGQRVKVKNEITDNSHVIREVFLLADNPRFSCCSHDVTSDVNEAMCNDFEWPPSRKTTTQSIEATDIPEIESHTRSGASTQFMSGFVWCFLYLLLYLSAFVAI